MKSILIEITGDDRADGGGVSRPLISLKANEPMRPDYIAGILLSAYQIAAAKFIDLHPKECHSCPAYLMHEYLLIRSRHMLEEVVKKL